MQKEILYFKCITDNDLDYTYSIDKMTILFFIDISRYYAFINDDMFARRKCGKNCYDYGDSKVEIYIYPQKGLNKQIVKGQIVLNPNKSFKEEECIEDIRQFLSSCKEYSITKIDLAIDIPVDRSLVHVRKNRQSYGLYKCSKDNKTEYLGKRNHDKNVRVYSKSVESKLDFPLTRVEMTMNLKNWESDIDMFPEIYILNSSEMNLSEEKLSGTFGVLVCLLYKVDEPEIYISDLGRRFQEKVRPYMQKTLIVPSKEIVGNLIKEYEKLLSIEEIVSQY